MSCYLNSGSLWLRPHTHLLCQTLRSGASYYWRLNFCSPNQFGSQITDCGRWMLESTAHSWRKNLLQFGVTVELSEISIYVLNRQIWLKQPLVVCQSSPILIIILNYHFVLTSWFTLTWCSCWQISDREANNHSVPSDASLPSVSLKVDKIITHIYKWYLKHSNQHFRQQQHVYTRIYSVCVYVCVYGLV